MIWSAVKPLLELPSSSSDSVLHCLQTRISPSLLYTKLSCLPIRPKQFFYFVKLFPSLPSLSRQRNLLTKKNTKIQTSTAIENRFLEHFLSKLKQRNFSRWKGKIFYKIEKESVRKGQNNLSIYYGLK